MKKIFFSLPGNEAMAPGLSVKAGMVTGSIHLRRFPDGETYLRLLSQVEGCHAVVVCTLDRPDDKLLPLHFLCNLLKKSGALSVTLVAPYLAYMRQDKQFNPGEAVTSEYFARLVSGFADRLVTIDPHLHRRHSLSEIYSIPCTVLHAAGIISDWVRNNVASPVLVGPDSESGQWVSEVAGHAGAPYFLLSKTRRGDREVEISMPDTAPWKNYTPVLVDDIISTAGTMIKATRMLKEAGMKAPVCVGVHGIFAGNSYEELLRAGAAEVVTTGSIPHPSNNIDITGLLAPHL